MKTGFKQKDKRSPEYVFLRWFFIRGLAVIYFIAFISLGTQVIGLIGKEGITPAGSMLPAVFRDFGPRAYWLAPTVFWINSSDAALQWGCWMGAMFSLLVFAGAAPRLLLFLCWALYLSYATVGQNFLGFQWDNLLLETGLLSIFFAEKHLSCRFLPQAGRPSLVILWLLRFLAFKLMFSSGAVKILSADQAWANLTALSYHYMTQPLPNPLSWYLHQWPGWFHKICVLGMLGAELVLPVFIFIGRRLRLAAFAGIVGLQLSIIATGNYCFFNLLTILLCFTLLDDEFLKSNFGLRIPQAKGKPQAMSLWEKIIINSFGIFISLIVVSGFLRMFPWTYRIAKPAFTLRKWVSPLRSINNYGLFAVMTTERPEIVFEGSMDGREWKEYEFPWKPGGLDRSPGWAAPHQPRLDWQLWFAALGGSYRSDPWVINFMQQVLKGSQPVLNLLKSNPFPNSPPRYMRALLYDYQFTTPQERRKGGHWWKRELIGDYAPVIFLK